MMIMTVTTIMLKIIKLLATAKITSTTMKINLNDRVRISLEQKQQAPNLLTIF